MKGQNAQQLIEGIQLDQSAGGEVRGLFQATMHGQGDQVMPHSRMSAGVDGLEQGIDS